MRQPSPAPSGRLVSFGRFRLAGAVLVWALALGGSAQAQSRLFYLSSTSSGNTSKPGSNTTVTQTTTAATTATAQNVQTSAAAQRAQISLQMSLQALQAQQAAQNAARAAAFAAASSVPNGLVLGGLVPDSGLASPGVANPVTTWVNAKTPTQTSSKGQTTVTVTQTAQQALLNWQTFNIGSHTTLNFDQSLGGANVGNWVAINKVAPNVAPSQILGSITAPGQVYVLNQNGIIFGGTSQVNVHALVASALPINPNLVSGGLLNNTTDYSYLFSSLEDSNGNALFTPQSTAQTLGNGNTSVSTGGITVQAGAQLTAPTTAEHVGGKIALIGPTVDNEGAISTPDGQTILAAGLQVGLKAHDTNDPTLRGLDVYLGAATDPSTATTGTVTNGGTINAERGDVTLAGANVQQNGVVASTTSVSLNGRIDLLAEYGTVSFVSSSGALLIDPSVTGAVTLGANSATQITPELSSTDTVVGSSLAESSLINIQALSIEMQPTALLWAPSAAVPTGLSPTTNTTIVAEDDYGDLLSSGVTLNAGSWQPNGTSLSLINNAGTIQLDTGSVLDVSGSENVSASVLENIVQAQLRGTELANSPVQQNGALRGQTVTIDLSQWGDGANGYWIGSPIGDLSGYADLVEHDVGELTTNGGTVSLAGGQSVNIASGASINVSGGWTNYAGATVSTTKVLTAGGQILDISQATPDLIYSGLYSGFSTGTNKWGVNQNYGGSLVDTSYYESGYIQGGNGGSLTIAAPVIALNGTLAGNTVAGIHQRSALSSLPTTFGSTTGLGIEQSIYGLPKAGSLTLSFTQQTLSGSSALNISPTPADVVFQPGNGTGALLANPFAGDGITQVVNLPANLVNADGFGNLKINDGDGDIAVPAGVALATSPGGSITFLGANIDILGSLTANGNGSLLSFSADLSSPYSDTYGPASRGTFTLGAGAVLDASGLIENDLPNSSSPNQSPLLTSSGNIDVTGYDVSLASGSLINVSGGIAVSSSGKQTFGAAGTISILAGQDPAFGAPAVNPDGAQLFLGATLEGYSGLTTSAGAGTLDVQAPLIQIGGQTLLNSDNSPNAVAQEGAGVSGDGTTLWLDPSGSSTDFFSQGGFGNISLTALGEVNRDQSLPSLEVASGATLAPIVQTWQSSINQNHDMVLSAITESLASQRAPLQLSLNAPGVKEPITQQLLARGSVQIDAGSSILTDPLGGVTLSAQTVAVQGNITAPGGKITITGASDSTAIFLSSSPDSPLPTVDIAGTLSTAGTTETTVSNQSLEFGLNTGNVLSGGTISISGNIVGEAGSLLNVNGASDTLDLPTGIVDASPGMTRPGNVETLESNGGSISLIGDQLFYWDGALSGSAGGGVDTSSAHGGSLSVSSGFFGLVSNQGVAFQNPGDATLVITASGPTIQSLGTTVLGNPVTGTQSLTDRDGNNIYGYFAANTFNRSGLDALSIGGTVQFQGPVALTANAAISVGNSGFIFANDAVTLTAPYVALGTTFPTPATQQTEATDGYIFTNSQKDVYYLAPQYGASGVLNVNASELTDIGDLSLQGIGTLNLNQGAASASAGDVRGAGILDVAGNINISASQIYPTTENTFTIAAFRDATAGATNSGNIVITGPAGAGSLPALPLSAGGTLNLYGDNIEQGGVLRAPLGTINLGASPSTVDLISSADFDQASTVSLLSGSVTSVSAVDPTTGLALLIPYGQNINGTEWEDPAGNNITASGNGAEGIPAKSINLVGATIQDDKNATIDVTGGGDLYAYRFVSGTGGTNDILQTASGTKETSFAIIPNYSSLYAPIDPTSGYVGGSNLSVGERIYLNASNGLAAGYYTLLPARYALLPGAFLVTPTGSASSGSAVSLAQTDGSSIVSGFTYSGLGSPTAPVSAAGYTTFDVASNAVVRSRAEYDNSYATSFLRQSALAQNQSVPLLPNDAGQVVFNASQSLTFDGELLGQPGTGGQNSVVEISSSSNILINGTGNDASFNGLVLGTDQLDSFNSGSLLIGGTLSANGTDVSVATSSIEVDDSSAPLTGNDIILVSNDALTLDPDAVIQSVASSTSSQAPALVVSGDGTLLRVSSSQGVQTSRTNVNTSDTTPMLTIGAGVKIESASSTATTVAPVGSLTLDSSAGIDLSTSATQSPLLSGHTVNFDGGLISVVFQDFTGAGNVAPTSGLVLSGPIVQALQQNATILSFLSYSTIDFYGDGTLGADAAGTPIIQDLSLQAAGIRGFAAATNSSNQDLISALTQRGVTLDAINTITVDNSAGSSLPAVSTDPTSSSGELAFNSTILQLGGGTGTGATNSVTIKGFGQVNVNASQQVLVAGSNSVTNSDTTVTPGQATLNVIGANLTVTTPLITGVTGSAQQINVTGGDLDLQPGAAAADTSLEGGLGATLGLAANQISDSGSIVLHSGQVTLAATGTASGDSGVTVDGTIDVSGVSPALQNLSVSEYTSGGKIALTSAAGNVAVGSGGMLNVSAPSGTGTADTTVGNAGTLTVDATTGTFSLLGGASLLGQGAILSSSNGTLLAQGANGNFLLDVATIDATGGLSDLTSLEQSLAAGNFTNAQDIRIRQGNVQAIDAGSTLTAHTFTLSADSGSILVGGEINASGYNGGAISLDATGSVTVAKGSLLTVEGQTFNDAGQGGSVSLDAGSYVSGGTVSSSSVVTIAGEINLQVDYLPVELNHPASASSSGDSVTITNPGTTIAHGTFYLPDGTPGNDLLQFSSGGTITNASGTTTFAASTPISIPAGSTVSLTNPAATVTFASGTGGSVPIDLASNAAFSASGATNLTGGAAISAAQAGDLSGTLHLRGPALNSSGNVIGILDSPTTPVATDGSQTPVSIAVGPITGTIDGASSIVVEGYQVFEPSGGLIDSTLEGDVSTFGTALVGNTGANLTKLYQGNANGATYTGLTSVEPGIEIVSTGDLTLQTTWDLSGLATGVGNTPASSQPFHFGANNVPGILTLQAAGNIVLDQGASLNDGFDTSSAGDPSGELWEASLLPSGVKSWSYNLVAGADLSAADPLRVNQDAGTSTGNLEEGFGSPSVDATATINAGSTGADSSTALLTEFYSTIRTGTGNITISTGNNVQLLNSLVTIYTAGTQVSDPTSVLSSDDFELPNLLFPHNSIGNGQANNSPYAAQYSMNGGNVTISSLGDIVNETSTSTSPDGINASNTVADSSRELPTSWLDRRGFTQNGVFAASHTGGNSGAGNGEIESTSWWVDFSNFFEGVGALGGGNLTLNAGGNVSNVDAVVPTNARMPGIDAQGDPIAPNASSLVELGGGDLVVDAGNNIDAGVYYVERGQGSLSAGNSIITNSTRATLSNSALTADPTPDSSTWMPTTLFLGKGSFDVAAGNSVLLGPVANAFLLPQNYDNSFFEKTYFSTYAASDAVNVSALTGDVVLKDSTSNGDASLEAWYENVLFYNNVSGEYSWSFAEPWLGLVESIAAGSGSSDDPFTTAYTIMPGTFRTTAFSGSINVLGSLTLSPSATGTLDLVAAGSINGLQPNGVESLDGPVSVNNPIVWSTATIDLSDANPASIPEIADPLSLAAPTSTRGGATWAVTSLNLYENVNNLFAETGSTQASLQTQQNLHADINGQTLHAQDPDPVQIYAGTGDISGVTFYSAKFADIIAGQDITDTSLYLQNNQADQISLVEAGRDILPYDPTSPLRVELQDQIALDGQTPNVPDLAGDLQIGGPGTLEVLAGRDLNLGQTTTSDLTTFQDAGVGYGLTSIGNDSNPVLSFGGADVVAFAGLGGSSGFTNPDYSAFISDFLTVGSPNATRYLPDLGALLGLGGSSASDISQAFTALPGNQQDLLALTVFYDVLRDAGRDHNTLGTDYGTGYQAIADLFPGNTWQGDITLTSREIKTESGGNISILVPGGQLTVGLPVNGTDAIDQGILTVDGGDISIFTNGNVNVGTSRIFTLHGGNEIIWSSNGDIAAGASSKTVQSAPPTRVLVDPQSGNIETDLAGLATGGGIGVLETVVGAPPSDVDLIAPKGTVDAGDAGIRASGNLSIAAVQVLNASNISVGGKSSGVPASSSSGPSIASLTAASSASGAATGAANEVARNSQPQPSAPPDLPSIITVEVIGYGGGDTD